MCYMGVGVSSKLVRQLCVGTYFFSDSVNGATWCIVSHSAQQRSAPRTAAHDAARCGTAALGGARCSMRQRKSYIRHRASKRGAFNFHQ